MGRVGSSVGSVDSSVVSVNLEVKVLLVSRTSDGMANVIFAKCKYDKGRDQESEAKKQGNDEKSDGDFGGYVRGWAGWSCSISKLCGLPLTKAFAFGQIGRQGGGFDAWHTSGLAIRIGGVCNERHTDGLSGRFIGGLPWNW